MDTELSCRGEGAPSAALAAKAVLRGTMPLGEVLGQAALLIKRFLPESPRLDAEVIVAGIWHKDAAYLFAHPEAVVPAEVLERVREAVVRRCAGCPVAYLLGERDFYGRSFFVNHDTLIPRPETEQLVEEACRAVACWEMSAARPKQALLALDLCTGSGNVAVSLALERPELTVWAQDISPRALEVAGRNVTRYGVNQRVNLLGGNLCECIPRELRFAVITANPPYIARDNSLPAEANVAKYEPHLALYGGADGLEVIRPLVHQARAFMEPGGCLLLEIGCDQGEAVENILATNSFKEIQILQDLQSLPRIAKAKFLP